MAASFWWLSLPLPAGLRELLNCCGATLGSLGAGILSALALTRGERRGRLTADAMVGVVFAGSSALAVLLVWRSSQGLVELKNILAGDVLLSSAGDLRSLWMGIAAVAILHAIERERFLLVAYDPPFARAQGLDVQHLERLFLISLAVSVAVALRAAGLMLVFGMLVLPPLVGLRVGSTLVRSSWVAVGAAWASTLGGFLLSTHLDFPVAPTIVAVQLMLLAVAMILPRLAEVLSLLGGLGALLVGLSLTAFAPPDVEAPPVAQAAKPVRGHGHARLEVVADPVQEQLGRLNDLRMPIPQREEAAARLGQMGKTKALRPLLGAMADFEDRIVFAARSALLTLASRPGGEGRRALLALAEDPDPDLATRGAPARRTAARGFPLSARRTHGRS